MTNTENVELCEQLICYNYMFVDFKIRAFLRVQCDKKGTKYSGVKAWWITSSFGYIVRTNVLDFYSNDLNFGAYCSISSNQQV